MRQANNLGLWRTGRPVESSIDSAVAAAAVSPDAPILVRPESIRRDGGTQMRAALDVATVHEYHDLIRDAALISADRAALASVARSNRDLDALIASMRQQLIALDADNARLTQELATLRSWVTAPSTGSPVEEVQP